MQYTRIRSLREDADLTQRAVAQAMGMYVTTYARYESGEREVPFNVIVALAKFYEVSADYIAGLTDNPTPYGISE